MRNDTIKINSKKTQMIAHRGVSGVECENTAAAFIAAGNRTYFGVETDVHVTADGVFVIIHDDTTGRVCDENLPVDNGTWESLKDLHLHDADGVTRRDLCLPLLEDYLQICRHYNKTAVLELKNAFKKEDIAKILEACGTEGIIYITFDTNNLIYLRELSDTAVAQLLTRQIVTDEQVAFMQQYRLDLDANYQWATKENIDRMHALGIKVNVWTVDDPAVAEQLADWGIDYITSNILE